jgi:hypothetical protein
MQALDYVGVLSSKTSPAAVIMETICCLVTFTLSLPQWWHAAQHTFPPQLSSSSPWHTADFHPMMMLLFLLFPTTLLPFHLGSSSIQCTLQSSLRGAYNLFFSFFPGWQNPNLSCTYALLYIRFSVYNLAVGGNNNSLVILKELL